MALLIKVHRLLMFSLGCPHNLLIQHVSHMYTCAHFKITHPHHIYHMPQ